MLSSVDQFIRYAHCSGSKKLSNNKMMTNCLKNFMAVQLGSFSGCELFGTGMMVKDLRQMGIMNYYYLLWILLRISCVTLKNKLSSIVAFMQPEIDSFIKCTSLVK